MSLQNYCNFNTSFKQLLQAQHFEYKLADQVKKKYKDLKNQDIAFEKLIKLFKMCLTDTELQTVTISFAGSKGSHSGKRSLTNTIEQTVCQSVEGQIVFSNVSVPRSNTLDVEGPDFVFIITSSHFMGGFEKSLVKTMNKKNVEYMYVKTKVDLDVSHQQRQGVSPEQTLSQIRASVQREMKQNKGDPLQILLVNTLESASYDFPAFKEWCEVLPLLKRKAHLKVCLDIVFTVISTKRDSSTGRMFKYKLWKKTLSGTFGGLTSGDVRQHFGNFISDELNKKKKEFGVDEESIRLMSSTFNVSLEELQGALTQHVQAGHSTENNGELVRSFDVGNVIEGGMLLFLTLSRNIPLIADSATNVWKVILSST